MYFYKNTYIIKIQKKKGVEKMEFIEQIKERARKDIKTIVLPEAEDIRILKATEKVLNEKYANIVLIGKKENILKKAETNNV